MIFTFLITIVFIAELIIAVTIVLNLKRFGNIIEDVNSTIISLNPSIKEVCILSRKISEQMLELTKKIVKKQEDILLQNIARVLLGALFFRKFKKSKVAKVIGKGLSLLEIVV